MANYVQIVEKTLELSSENVSIVTHSHQYLRIFISFWELALST